MSRNPFRTQSKTDQLSQRDICQFLPAALEIEQTPASPAGRLILHAIVALFVIAVLWAVFGRIDIVAVAEGRVIPSERVKVIQPIEAASVSAIHVRDGQQVKAGEPLVTLDTTMTEADVRRLTQEWLDAKAQRLRLERLVHWFQQDAGEIPVIISDDPDLKERIAKQNLLLQQEISEYQANMGALGKEYDRLEAELGRAGAEINRSRRILEVMNERVNALNIMQQKKMGSRAEFLELKQQQIEIEESVSIQRAVQKQLKASMESNLARQESMSHEHHKNILMQWQDVQAREASLLEEKHKAVQRNRQYSLRAPLDGTVQQLAIHTVGGVVTPAQELMLVVPADSDMEIEAMILNKDIGFVQQGQPAEIKVNTFNFTKYGVVNAELVDISTDAVQHEQLGLVYKAKLRLKDQGLMVGNRHVPLSPGMAVTAEVKTGHRRIIEFFLSPLLRYKEESLGER